MKVDLKSLKGQNQFPDDVAPGDKEGSGKFALGNNQLVVENNLLYADNVTAGVGAIAPNEAHSVPAASGPYTVTVTNSAHFIKDLGVRYGATGVALARVASSPTVGEYAVASGVYTFAAADTLAAVLISYVWTDSTAGNTLTVNNQIMGYGPIVEIYFAEQYQSVGGVPNGLHLFQVRIGSQKKDVKRDGYLIPEYDFQAFPNAGGAVFEEFQVAN